jgi:hypothetical protein
MRYLHQRFRLITGTPPRLRCCYCDNEIQGAFVATAEGFDEPTRRRKYHPADSRWATAIRPENLLVFETAGQALAQGFHPAMDVHGGAE